MTSAIVLGRDVARIRAGSQVCSIFSKKIQLVANSNPTVKQPSPLRIALFGAGRHAQHHARAILRCAGAELVAVTDPSEVALAAMRGIARRITSMALPKNCWLRSNLTS